MKIELQPVATVRCTRTEIIDDSWDSERVRIELDTAKFGADALLGLAEFSHLMVVFYMHRIEQSGIVRDARSPRNNPEWPRIGVFAQRTKNRPNQIGVSVCRVVSVEGSTIHVEGLDAIDGTPVLDLKPWVDEFGPRGKTRQPKWASELMENFW